MGESEFNVLLAEFKADLNAYLATLPLNVETRTLADLIAFNEAHSERELALFGQDTFVEAEATKGLENPGYIKARQTSLRLEGPDGIARPLKDSTVIPLVGPTISPAWLIHPLHGPPVPAGSAATTPATAG